ncbi:MAG: hypothetical protein EAZ89_16160 [Bacteroidetes bacterium]|nr:MAG: hypothetical protein EAZ89_16160 [Bacteroidota bacterium]
MPNIIGNVKNTPDIGCQTLAVIPMKFLRPLFTVLFALFAWYQLNDPDSWFWTILYVALSICVGLSDRKEAERPMLITGAFCVAGLLRYLPGLLAFLFNKDGISFSMGMQNDYPYIEEAREFGGMLISTLVLFYFWWSNYRKAQG